MINLRTSLLALADAYSGEVDAHGGKSLARVSTIVLNQGGFFQRLRDGKTCTLDSFEAILRWFSSAENWPRGLIPDAAAALLTPLASDIHSTAE